MYKVLGSLEKRTVISSQSSGLQDRLVEKVIRLSKEVWLGICLGLMWSGDADGPK